MLSITKIRVFCIKIKAEFLPVAANGPFGQPSRMMLTAPFVSPSRQRRWTSTKHQQVIQLPCKTISGWPTSCETECRQQQLLAEENDQRVTVNEEILDTFSSPVMHRVTWTCHCNRCSRHRTPTADRTANAFWRRQSNKHAHISDILAAVAKYHYFGAETWHLKSSTVYTPPFNAVTNHYRALLPRNLVQCSQASPSVGCADWAAPSGCLAQRPIACDKAAAKRQPASLMHMHQWKSTAVTHKNSQLHKSQQSSAQCTDTASKQTNNEANAQVGLVSMSLRLN